MGYSSDDDTWEGEENLFCDLILQQYKDEQLMKKQQKKTPTRSNRGKRRKRSSVDSDNDEYKEESRDEISQRLRKKTRKSIVEYDSDSWEMFDGPIVKDTGKKKGWTCSYCNSFDTVTTGRIRCSVCDTKCHEECVPDNIMILDGTIICDDCV